MPPRPPSTPGSGKPDPQAISDFLDEEGFRWLKVPNIVGVSIGEKKRAGQTTGELAVIFDVIAKFEASPDIVRAGSRPIPETIEIAGHRLPTDIVEAWPEPHGSQPVQRKSRLDPICGGVSVGSRLDTGTLGAILWHRPTNQPVALSNWHVLANSGSDKDTVQPGPKDDRMVQNNPLGRWQDAVLDANLDAAITTIEHRSIDANIADLGVPVRTAASPADGMRVVKSGKTTEVTYGLITMRRKPVSFPFSGLAERHNMSVCVIRPDPARPSEGPICGSGDSGSCWMRVDDNGRTTDTMVGLHMGGEEDGMTAYACHADLVFARLGLEPLGERDLADAGPPPLERRYVVIARDGLILRAGPGVDFARRGVGESGQIVSVIGSNGDWLMVDLEGDGKADGFMHGSFLKPAEET